MRTRVTASVQELLPAVTSSPAETAELGSRLASTLEPGSILALTGDLGAGKTQFARGLCRGLGVDEREVTSPTFTIVQAYKGRLPVYHIDAYRIEHVDEFHEMGYEEMFFGDGVTIIEWPELVEALVPDSALRIRLEHAGGDARRITVVDEAVSR